MNSTTTATTIPGATTALGRTPAARRIFGVVARPQSYRNIGYLLLGLPLGTIWFTVLLSGLAVGLSTLVVALLGVPVLLGIWYATRWCANVERSTANALLDQHLAHAAVRSPAHGNLWARLRSMSRDRDRWRELGYLLARFPVGVATFTVAVTALATPFLVAYAPFAARYGDSHPFGDWSQSSRMEDIASSPWSWFLVPLGAAMLVGAFHVLNVAARACGRWASTSLAATDAQR